MTDAAQLVRSARERAGMSARDLATASGVSPSTVSRIERGEINPTIAVLERLIGVVGDQLEVRISRGTERPTMAALRSRREEIEEIVTSRGAGNVRVFGSVARGDAGHDSDVDLLIDVPPGTGLIAVEAIAQDIEQVIPWPVDVMTSGAARGRLASVLDEAVAL